MVAAAGLVQDVVCLEAERKGADVLGDLRIPLPLRLVEAVLVASVEMIAHIGGQFKLVRGSVAALQAYRVMGGIHVERGCQRITGQRGRCRQPQPQGKVLGIELETQIAGRGERGGEALFESTLPAIETGAGSIAPEIGHERRIVKLVFVQSRQGPRRLITGLGVKGEVGSQGQGPQFLAVQREGIVCVKPGVKGGSAGIYRYGIQNPGGVVPAGVPHRRHAQ